MPAPSLRAHLRMPQIEHSPESGRLGGEAIDHYLKAIPILIAEPFLTGKALAEILSVPPGSIGKISQAARKTLGITLNGDFVKVSTKLAEAAKALGLEAPNHVSFSRKYGPPVQVSPAGTISAPAQAENTESLSLSKNLKKIHAELSAIMAREGISSIEVTEKTLTITRIKTVTETLRL